MVYSKKLVRTHSEVFKQNFEEIKMKFKHMKDMAYGNLFIFTATSKYESSNHITKCLVDQIQQQQEKILHMNKLMDEIGMLQPI